MEILNLNNNELAASWNKKSYDENQDNLENNFSKNQ